MNKGGGLFEPQSNYYIYMFRAETSVGHMTIM